MHAQQLTVVTVEQAMSTSSEAMLRALISKITGSNSNPIPSARGRCRKIE
jgi:hypothetical protein